MSEPLSNDDFKVEGGKLQLLRPGFYAVLLMSKNDQNCISLAKILNVINVDRLHVAYLDITSGGNRNVITMSRDTKTNISGIPYLGFFVEGTLKSRYKGEVSKDSISKYFTEKVFEARSKSVNQREETPKFSMDAKRPSQAAAVEGANQLIGRNVAWRADQVKK